MLKRSLRWLLKHSRSFLSGSCFALALAVTAWIGSLSPSYQKCATEHERHYGNNESTNLHKRNPDRWKIMPAFLVCEGAFIDENNGTLAALATVAIAAFTLTLWRATTEHGRITDRVLELTRDEFNATHRPKIIVRHFGLEPPFPDARLQSHYTVINIGITDAEIVSAGGDIWFASPTSRPRWEPPGIDAEVHATTALKAIVSGEGVLFRCASRQPVSQALFARWRGGELNLVIVGSIIYADRRGTKRRMAFLRTYNQDFERFIPSNDPDYEYED